MSPLLTYALLAAALTLSATALFFFMTTRGALLYRQAADTAHLPGAHVYPIYSNLRLMRLVDFQPVISAILLFQYSRLVTWIVDGLRRSDLEGRDVLITSCAFGNVMPRVVDASLQQGAARIRVLDIIQNELDHAAAKLVAHRERLDLLRADAAQVQIADGTIAANVMFFLLHELPHDLKGQVLREAVRVLTPGGRLYLAEFHRPDNLLLRALSWLYFTVYEPYGLALWDSHDPMLLLNEIGGLHCERRTCCFGNFQVIVATRIE
jgi:SAM-dependent methyltransferase